MKDRYWTIMRNDVLKNKKLIFTAIFMGILCFGFTITNFSIGVDDPAAFHYFNYDANCLGNMIQQGRLTHVLIYLITGISEFIPFFNDFVGTSLFVLSSLLFCAVFKLITNNKISDLCLIAFISIYISYPITVNKFIFNLDVIPVMISYCGLALSIAYSYMFMDSKKPMDFVNSVLTLMLALGSYESFLFIYICAVFSIFILKIIVNNEKIKFKDLLTTGLKYAAILLCAVIIYYLIVTIIQLSTGQFNQFERYNPYIGLGFIEIIKLILKYTFAIPYNLITSKYFPVLEFAIICIVGLIVSIVFSIKKKSFSLFFSYVAFVFSSVIIFYVTGGIVYRVAQSFPFVASIIVMLIVYELSKKDVLKKVCIVCVTILIFVQAANINMYFYKDYRRYKKDEFAVNTIATELIKYDVSKPVVFINNDTVEYLFDHGYDDSGFYSTSLVDFSLKAFDDTYYDHPVFNRVFEILGYEFVKRPNEEQFEEGKELSKDMPAFPNDGYIEEYEDIIVVKIS